MRNKTLHYVYLCHVWTTQAQVRCTQIYYITERGAQVTLGNTTSVQLKSKRPHETHILSEWSWNRHTAALQLVFMTESSSKIYFKRDLQHASSTTIHKYMKADWTCAQSQQHLKAEFCVAFILLAKNKHLGCKKKNLDCTFLLFSLSNASPPNLSLNCKCVYWFLEHPNRGFKRILWGLFGECDKENTTQSHSSSPPKRGISLTHLCPSLCYLML